VAEHKAVAVETVWGCSGGAVAATCMSGGMVRSSSVEGRPKGRKGGGTPSCRHRGGRGSRRGPAPWREWRCGRWHTVMGRAHDAQQGKWVADE
jgi:hypothetical protein